MTNWILRAVVGFGVGGDLPCAIGRQLGRSPCPFQRSGHSQSDDDHLFSYSADDRVGLVLLRQPLFTETADVGGDRYSPADRGFVSSKHAWAINAC